MQAVAVRQELRRTYVLDTSVLLSDPRAMTRFAEHESLSRSSSSPNSRPNATTRVGLLCRSALRMLDELRVEHGRLDAPCRSTTRAARSSSSSPFRGRRAPAGLPARDNAPASWPSPATSPRGREVTLVSKDLPMRVRPPPSACSPRSTTRTCRWRAGWTGITELTVGSDVIDSLYEGEPIILTRRQKCRVTRVWCCSRTAARTGPDHAGQEDPPGQG